MKMASKLSRACDISPKVRKEVMERDGGKCIICGSTSCLQIAHFIPRSRLGLGIPQNLAVLCVRCHGDFDNGKSHKEIQKLFREHLQASYEDWDERELIYSKWRNLK
jgi:5-methylcytosine-specific restriction endonuclease McrA